MGGFFSLLIGWFVYMVFIFKEYQNEDSFEKKSIHNSAVKKIPFYYDKTIRKRLLSNNKLIYSQVNAEGDLCYFDEETKELIYNDSENKRNQCKNNAIHYAKTNNLKTFILPYVYKIKNKRNETQYLSETVETTTLQPFQLKYIPIEGYGFVKREAPAIDPSRTYDLNYKNNELKWSKWHVISKEEYVSLSGKPIYEYELLQYYDLKDIIKK